VVFFDKVCDCGLDGRGGMKDVFGEFTMKAMESYRRLLDGYCIIMEYGLSVHSLI
jgi:hypothetical protein